MKPRRNVRLMRQRTGEGRRIAADPRPRIVGSAGDRSRGQGIIHPNQFTRDLDLDAAGVVALERAAAFIEEIVRIRS